MKARHQKCGNDSVDLSDPKGKPAPASLWFSHLYPDGSSSSGEKTNHTLLLITPSVAQRKQSRHVLFLFLVYLLFLPNDQEREEKHCFICILTRYIVSGVKKSSWHKGWHVSPAHGCCSCFHSTLVTGVSHTFPEFSTPVGTWRWAQTT